MLQAGYGHTALEDCGAGTARQPEQMQLQQVPAPSIIMMLLLVRPRTSHFLTWLAPKLTTLTDADACQLAGSCVPRCQAPLHAPWTHEARSDALAAAEHDGKTAHRW